MTLILQPEPEEPTCCTLEKLREQFHDAKDFSVVLCDECNSSWIKISYKDWQKMHPKPVMR